MIIIGSESLIPGCYPVCLLLIAFVSHSMLFFFFQAEDGIRDSSVTGVQTCALPICFTDVESERLARVAILGPTTVENLFGADNPLGEFVKINGVNYSVIGVTKAKGDQGWFNPD